MPCRRPPFPLVFILVAMLTQHGTHFLICGISAGSSLFHPYTVSSNTYLVSTIFDRKSILSNRPTK